MVDSMKQFETDKEIYCESIDAIELLNESRLYKEEQIQITEEAIRIRNSI